VEKKTILTKWLKEINRQRPSLQAIITAGFSGPEST